MTTALWHPWPIHPHQHSKKKVWEGKNQALWKGLFQPCACPKMFSWFSYEIAKSTVGHAKACLQYCSKESSSKYDKEVKQNEHKDSIGDVEELRNDEDNTTLAPPFLTHF